MEGENWFVNPQSSKERGVREETFGCLREEVKHLIGSQYGRRK